MKVEKFKEFIKAIEYQGEESSKLYDLKIDLIEYDDMFHKIISIVSEEYFTPDGWDAIQAYLYERPKENKPWFWEADGSVIPMYTVDDLHNYLIKEKYIK